MESKEDAKDHSRKENKRIIESTGKDIQQSGQKIGLDIKFKTNPEYLAERLQIWDELYQNQQKKLEEMPREPIKVTLPDGKVHDCVSFQTSPMDIAKEISNSLAGKVVVSSVKYKSRVATLDSHVSKVEEEDDDEVEEGWTLWDLTRPLEGDCDLKLHSYEDKEGKMAFWHSSAHVLGQCMETEFGVHLCYGPATQDGFYYDAHSGSEKFTQDNYKKLEDKAKKIASEKQPFERLVLTKEEALRLFDYNPFKIQLITNKVADGANATAYRCGPLIDLCMGPHLPNTSRVKAFKIMKNSSAYWLGDNQNDSLQRVYGISFPNKKDLTEYLHFREEAERRDHRTVGKNQKLFYSHPYSPGCFFFTKEGSTIYNNLLELMRHQYSFRGYSEVMTPNIYNLRLWKISGHYQNYKENMFMFGGDGCGMGVKPMNCPGHYLLFQSQIRSYRDLPIRFADFGVLHRNELAGALTGLTRVRRFQQDDAHIFCMKEQIHEEIKSCLDFVDFVYGIFGFKYDLHLSTKPEKYLGDDDLWEEAEEGLTKALNEFGKPWKENPGDGAFYGPKIDITLYDAMNRGHQCGTIQLDFQAPIRFNLVYKSDSDNLQDDSHSSVSKHSETDTSVKNYYEFPADEFDKEVFKWEEHEPKHGYKRPVIIHRAILGSLERFFSILIEHIDGKWPFWLSPKQAIILPVSEKFHEYAQKVNLALQQQGFHSMVEVSNMTINKKVRNAQLAQWNYMLIVGQDEQELGMVNVRNREGEIIGLKRVDDLIDMFKNDKAPQADREKETYQNIWKAEDFPFSQEKFEEVKKNEADNAEKYKLLQAEKKQKQEEVRAAKEAKGGKKGKKEKNKDEGKPEDKKEGENKEDSKQQAD